MSIKDEFNRQFQPAIEDISLPERLAGRYRPESCLASREDGEVWLLGDAEGGRYVLKIDRTGKRDLAGEFALMERLPRELAVPLPVDCFEEGGVRYLLRTYLPGQPLAEVWKQGDAGRCVEIGVKLCALLEKLHNLEQPVIHRDIKPENIILSPEGEPGLIDFGIARVYKEGQDADTMFMGTRLTAPPEQYGYAQTDRRADIYSLGVTLCWMLTGSYKLEALEGADCPEGLKKCLSRAAAFDPQNRYQSAAELSAALGGSAPRRKGLLAAALLCVLVLAGGLLWAARPGPASKTPNPPPPPASTSAPVPAQEPVVFSSRSMEAAVRQALERPEGEITLDELGQIRRLAVVGENALGPEQDFDYRISCYVDYQYQSDLPVGDITDADLSLLAHMPELETLYLCRQKIRDISALEGLPLTALYLCDNEILDLSPLASLTDLETLYLGGNPATDYGVLASLARLKILSVEGGPAGFATLESLAFLDSLTLRELCVGMTVAADGDWSPLSRQVGLVKLQLWAPPDEAVAAAGALPVLRTLTVADYYGSDDLTPFSGLTALEVLNLHKGSFKSLEGVQHMGRLLTLAAGYNGIADLSPLTGLEYLSYLQLEGLDIADFSPLMELPALGYVVVPQALGEQVETDCPGHAFELRTF